MSVLDKLARAAAREAAQKVRHLSEHVSLHGDIDEWVLRDLKAIAPGFREALETPITLADGTVHEPSADLHDSIFLTAHTPGRSEARELNDVLPSHRFGGGIFGEFIRTEAHEQAKPYTQGDRNGAAVYSRAAIEEYDRIMRDKSVQEQAQQEQALHEQEQQIKDILDALDAARQQAKDAHDAGEPIPGELVQEVKDLIAAREQAAGELAQMPVPEPGTPTAVGQALEQAAEQGKERAEVWNTLAGLGGDALRNASPDAAWGLAEAWMQVDDFRELCELIGQLQRDFRAQEARNVIGGTDEIVGIELGNNLTHTLPSELARLGDPATRQSFMLDYIEEGLLQFETQGSERANLGPGILLLDASSSMGGRKMLEAKGVVVGFVRLMHRRNRDALVVVFNGTVQWEHHFPKRRPLDMDALLRLAKIDPSGGTRGITAACVRAKHFIDRSPTFKRADVMVVTDGEVGFTPEAAAVRDHFQKIGVRSHGIAIAHEPEPDKWLLQFCDDAISVKQLTEATGDIVRAVS
jgi:uncharacterized protein with von Willebrand factor type A (vWA) domain